MKRLVTAMAIVSTMVISGCSEKGGSPDLGPGDGEVLDYCVVDAKDACSDGVRNGTETDVDCGGYFCPPCGYGKACSDDTDCLSRYCAAGKCLVLGCGNGKVDGKEECDGTVQARKTCLDYGFNFGTLTCTMGCTLDTSGCSNCGDNKIAGQEKCDGTDLGGKTCKSFGFDSGSLSCSKTCTFDTASCFKCGDGKVDGTEECDGKVPAGKTCQGYGLGPGSLKCTATCDLDKTGCSQCSPSKTYSVAHIDEVLVYNSACSLSANKILENPELVVDAQGKVHLLYAKDLLYVTNASGAWKEIALAKNSTLSCNALAIDPTGKVHVATVGSGGLEYRTNSSGGWTTTSIHSGKVECRVSMVAWTAKGVAVAFVVTGSTQLIHGTLAGGKWTTQQVMTGIAHHTMVRDALGKFHIGGATSSGVGVISGGAGKWQWQKVASYHPSPMMAMDGKGALHLVYNNPSTLSAIHATNATGPWVKSTVLYSRIATAMDVSSTGKIYIVYTSPLAKSQGSSYMPIPSSACVTCYWSGYHSWYNKTGDVYLRSYTRGAWRSRKDGLQNCSSYCHIYSSTSKTKYYTWDDQEHSVHRIVVRGPVVHMASIYDERYRSEYTRTKPGAPHKSKCYRKNTYTYKYSIFCP